MKRVKIILICVISLLIFTCFAPINIANADTKYEDVYNYHSTVKLEGKITNLSTNEVEEFNRVSKVLDGNYTDSNVVKVINEFKDEFTNLAISKEGSEISFEENKKQNKKEFSIQMKSDIGTDPVITTIYDVYQTITITATSVIKTVEYNVISGNDQTIVKKKKNNKLIFKFDIPEEKFNDSLEVYIDQIKVEPSNYILGEDISLSFSDEYIKSLEVRSHVISVYVKNGIANTTFNVIERNINTMYIIIGILVIIILICIVVMRTVKKK